MPTKLEKLTTMLESVSRAVKDVEAAAKTLQGDVERCQLEMNRLLSQTHLGSTLAVMLSDVTSKTEQIVASEQKVPAIVSEAIQMAKR